jgi:NAD(P)H dehydrogenase (quinone)
MAGPAPTIGVTGATGAVGGRTARLLAEAGHPVRLLVRDPGRAPRLPGASVARVSYGDAAAAEALRGVRTLLMVSAAEAEDRLAQHRAFVDAAAAAGVRSIVYTSFVGASATSGFTLGRDHGATEAAVRGSGMSPTFLRDTFYAEVWPGFADEQGVIRGPAGNGRVAVVSRRDVADVAALVLADRDEEPERHAGATYDLTGPEALTLAEIAEILSRVIGRPHRFEDETVEQARASRASYGAPEWQLQAWVSTYTAIRNGELATVSDDVPRLLGRPATTFAEAVRGR